MWIPHQIPPVFLLPPSPQIPHQIPPVSFLLPGPQIPHIIMHAPPDWITCTLHAWRRGNWGTEGEGEITKVPPSWLPSMGKDITQILLVVKPHKYQIILFHLFNDHSNNIVASWTAWHTQSPANYCYSNMHVHVICTCTCTCMHIHITCTVQRSYIYSLPFYNIRLIKEVSSFQG